MKGWSHIASYWLLALVVVFFSACAKNEVIAPASDTVNSGSLKSLDADAIGTDAGPIEVRDGAQGDLRHGGGKEDGEGISDDGDDDADRESHRRSGR